MRFIIVYFLLICHQGFSQNEVCFDLGKNPISDIDGFAVFSKHVDVFGLHVLGTFEVADENILHAAAILAECIDNNEDGLPDNPTVLSEIVSNNGGIVIFPTEEDPEIEEFLAEKDPEYEVLVLTENFIVPEGSSESEGFDETLRVALNLMSSVGYNYAYPNELGENIGTDLALAMNEARGGYFPFVPPEYPEDAWFHFTEVDCDYFCQIQRYFYWAVSTNMGAQSYPGRCEEIVDEWELCEVESFQTFDLQMNQIIQNELYHIPQSLPNGSYCPTEAVETTNYEAEDKINLNLTSSEIEIQSKGLKNILILDYSGNIIFDLSQLDKNVVISTETFTPGIYLIKVNNEVFRIFIP